MCVGGAFPGSVKSSVLFCLPIASSLSHRWVLRELKPSTLRKRCLQLRERK